jgi:hypothetical protein
VRVGIFGSKQKPSPATGFDGAAGAAELDRLVSGVLECAARGRTDGVLELAQQIFLAKPGDAKAPMSGDFLVAPWKWIMAVSGRAASEGNRILPAKIGLMCQLWNRVLLASEPRYQMGRLVRAPLDIEFGLYRLALTALVAMQPGDVLVPGGGQGWVAAEALEQVSQTVRALIGEGTEVDAELRGLATGDPAAVAAARGASGAGPESGGPGNGHDQLLDRLDETVEQAGQGDTASDIYLRGLAVQANGGDDREALRYFEAAGRLGFTDAMYDAGCLAQKLGDMDAARYWWEAAAKGGNGQAAQNRAAAEVQAGRLSEALPWFLKAAELGNAEGYAALTQAARDAGDHAQELRWSRLGAEAGHPFCMLRFGAVTMRYHGDDPQAVRAALPYLERAGELGDPDAMFLAGLGHGGVGNHYEARLWLQRAEQAGHPRARQALTQFGL